MSIKSENEHIINVIITDDHVLYRAGVKTALSSKKDIKVIAEADNGSHLMALLKALHPDVILLDIQMPIMDGITTLAEIKKLYPDIKVIMLTMVDDHSMITKLMELGANSYLTKTSDSEIIYQAIKTCHEQEFYFNSLTNKALLNNLRQRNPIVPEKLSRHRAGRHQGIGGAGVFLALADSRQRMAGADRDAERRHRQR